MKVFISNAGTSVLGSKWRIIMRRKLSDRRRFKIRKIRGKYQLDAYSRERATVSARSCRRLCVSRTLNPAREEDHWARHSVSPIAEHRMRELQS